MRLVLKIFHFFLSLLKLLQSGENFLHKSPKFVKLEVDWLGMGIRSAWFGVNCLNQRPSSYRGRHISNYFDKYLHGFLILYYHRYF